MTEIWNLTDTCVLSARLCLLLLPFFSTSLSTTRKCTKSSVACSIRLKMPCRPNFWLTRPETMTELYFHLDIHPQLKFKCYYQSPKTKSHLIQHERHPWSWLIMVIKKIFKILHNFAVIISLQIVASYWAGKGWTTQ